MTLATETFDYDCKFISFVGDKVIVTKLDNSVESFAVSNIKYISE